MKINMFRGDLSDISLTVKFFPKVNNLFFGYFDPTNILFDSKNK